MSSQAGWYPDPGGTPGKYRYWDGTRWSAQIRDAPPQAPQAPPYGPTPPEPPRHNRAWAWWAGAAAALVVLVLLVTWGIRAASRIGPTVNDPSGQASTDICPPPPTETPSPVAHPADGRVHGGKLSYPQLADPWSIPEPEYNLPFSYDASRQQVMVQPNFDGLGSDWVASVTIGQLVAGDGFFSPQEGAQIVAQCVVGRFYGDAVVTRNDVTDKAATVDGHDAWVLESQLSFHIDGLQTEGERMILVVVDTGDGEAGLYYASIPDTVPDLVQPARDAMNQLAVDG